MTQTKENPHKWLFKARFRRNAFGWRPQPAIGRIREAVSEIKRVARTDKVLAAEGAVSFLERLSPALAQVDSSSGAIGNAVFKAIEQLVPIIAAAPADPRTREGWLERLFQAHGEDRMPYIEELAEYWGELCADPRLASTWADRLLEMTRRVLHPAEPGFHFFHGTSACLSALYAAGRQDELIELLEGVNFWPYARWAVKALAAQGRKAEAVRRAEMCRGTGAGDVAIDRACEEILLSSGMLEEAYRRYGLVANRRGTYLAWFRAVLQKYPHKSPTEVLGDLVALTPGHEGKWFAAAKDAGLFQEAAVLANRSPCSPQTLARAARDFADTNPGFAVQAGMAALRWMVEGFGYDITSLEVLDAYFHTMKAARNLGEEKPVQDHIRNLVAKETLKDRFVTRVLAPHLGISPGSDPHKIFS
ncbi:MAG: hypothetical protein H5U10_08645 [Desulfacinum sp.]|jgi:hypothetical protein|nr:hypothetical protein [Desulfacinum sp.]MBZ4659050.1 hypothetical protein [Desulfacinum sp.]